MLSLLLVLACASQLYSQSLPRELTLWSSLAVLTTSNVLDYHSSKSAQRHGAVESNPAGVAVGSFGSSVVCGIVGYYIHRRGGGLRWIGSVLIAGASIPHFYAAVHNYRIGGK